MEKLTDPYPHHPTLDPSALDYAQTAPERLHNREVKIHPCKRYREG
ncbi:MAG: hypothetical protein NW237_11510 [Cyanobacteriota bacterium]|nr:hypothetical protein [Cyanobacteriota bacterium]